jgi:hypoxanthine phosphoribosyltransferase
MRYDFTWQQFDAAILALSHRLQGEKIEGIYGVPRGGLVLAVALSHHLRQPLRDSVKDDTLVVDDIADTGFTLLPYRHNKIVTLHWVKESLITPLVYFKEKSKEDWIVYPWEVQDD